MSTATLPTFEEFAAMEPGVNKDCFVAEVVMDWGDQGIERHFQELPRFTTTGDGMLRVIERMREMGFDMLLEYNDCSDDDEQPVVYSVRCSFWKEFGERALVSYGTIPDACANAAYAALSNQ